MGRYTTKEEDVAKISTSLFITNFPESTSAKELFNVCKQYGHVVDTFIPTKRSKEGKRFGFVRFINVFSVKSLVNNLCTVWIDRLKLHANFARFNRASVNSHNHATQNVGGSKSNHNNTAMNDNGELLDIDDHEETCFHSKRLCILTKDYRSISEDFKIVFGARYFGSELKKRQETGNGVNSDAEKVPETAAEEEGQEENNADAESLEKTDDKQFEIPPGYTPIEGSETSDINKEGGTSNNYEKVNEVNVEELQNLSGNGCSKYSKEVESDSICSGRFKKSKGPKTGGSILNSLDEVVKVGQVMAYKMDGYMLNMVEIIESQGAEEGVWRQSGKDVLLIAVYAPHDFKEKLLLWDYLNRSIGRWNGEVIIMEYFNKVRYKLDMFGTVFHTQGANAFNSFIYSAGLVEVSLGGCSFTWCHKSATKMSKLDRFLVSETLFNSCPNISALSLERYLSNHRPILLRESYFDYGPAPFRFFHYWSDLEGFGNVVEAAWKEYPNRMSMDKDKYKVDLEALDTIIDRGNWNEEIVKQRSEIVSKLLHIDKLSSVEMAQKAKVKWSIEGIMVDGSWDDEPSIVKRGFFNHFRNRFDKPDVIRAITYMEYPRRISLDKQSKLGGEVSNDEIKRAVWDCGTDKAPGSDGFTFGFYRRFWYLIDNDVYAAVKHFFIPGEIPKGCNSSFIALIPNISDANLVKDFHPISLIGSLYKIIAKILANRLAGVLGDIVNEVQSAFVADGQILDGPFILNEDFLDGILGKFGFGDKWRMWIQSCLKSSRGSIIINGSLTEEFQFFKGIKQGDPLSPFLFILVMESLHLSFQRVEEAKMFKGMKIGPTVTLSHMFYADDAVLVGKWCESNITTLVYVFDCFHRASGLKINMSKIKILGVHVESDRVKEAALRLGCLTLKTPFLYLGSKVGGSMSRLHEWDEVVERVKMRLSKWKMKSLSIGGRLTLLKSVLGSMTIFNMSIFKVPLGVLRTLESIRSHFFNGHALGSNKASWAMYGDKGKIDAKVKIGSRSCWLNIVHEAKILTRKVKALFFDDVRTKSYNWCRVSEAAAELHGVDDSRPDMSFETSASSEYMSGLYRTSLTKVVRCVSPSLASRETIPHHSHCPFWTY
nr:putative RNA-directed DNA polymerase, eukaryota, reverse transcriptase zinc-binding domain protein [Tanacetum cinerariifolium]